MPLSPGQTLKQRYQIQSTLGRGGMGVDYQAYDHVLQRTVAIKVLPPRPTVDVEFVTRFQREVMASANLRHPNIMTVYDVGQQDGEYFIIMEYLNGTTLKQWLAQHGPMPAAQASQVVDQIASALDYAHARGIIHRDVKPSNIMLDSYESAVLMDFGLVRAGEGFGPTRSTVVGTPEYMAPEQALGRPVDGRTDIYSLGVVIYEMLSGHVPFARSTPIAIAHAHVYDLPPPLREGRPDLPKSVESVVFKALAKRAEDRYNRAGDLARDLAAAVSGADEHPSHGSRLQRRLRDLEEELDAVYRHQRHELDEVNRVRLRRHAEELENELKSVAERLKHEPDLSARFSGSRWRSQDRVLDAAIPRIVYAGKATELLVQVRLVPSSGLRAVLEVDTTYAPKPEEVLSKKFVVEFPLNSAGQPEVTQLRIRVVSRDFDPQESEKRILVPPHGDSEIVTFQLVPRRIGELVVHVEVYKARIFAASRPLRTNSQAEEIGKPIHPRYVVVSFPVIAIPVDAAAFRLTGDTTPPVVGLPRTSPTPSPQRRSGRVSSVITLLLIILAGATLGGITYVQLGSSSRVTPVASPTLDIMAPSASSTPTASFTATPTSTSTPSPTATTRPTATPSVTPTLTMTATPTATSTTISITSPTAPQTPSP